MSVKPMKSVTPHKGIMASEIKFSELTDRYEKITVTGNSEHALAIDEEFNEYVAKCCRNHFAADSLRPYHAHARRLYYRQYYADVNTIKQINNSHCNVMRAIASGDENKAVNASDELIDWIIKLYKDNYMITIE